MHPVHYTIRYQIILHFIIRHQTHFFLRLLTLAVMGVLINMRACVPMLALSICAAPHQCLNGAASIAAFQKVQDHADDEQVLDDQTQ